MTSPASPPLTREELARIIDPEALAPGAISATGKPFAGSVREREALAKADAILARLQAQEAGAVEALPDLFWDAEDPETGGQDEWGIVDPYPVGSVVRVMCARSMPDMWTVRIPAENSDGDDDTCPLFANEDEAREAYRAALQQPARGEGE